MAFRDDGVAARERLKALEDENARLRADNERLQRAGAAPNGPKRSLLVPGLVMLALLLFGAAAVFGIALDGQIAALALANLGVVTLSGAIIVAMVQRFMHVVGPNTVLVLSGRSRRAPDGSVRGYRCIRGGRAFRLPLIERAQEMDLSNHIIDTTIRNAHVKGGTVEVNFVANVRVAGNEPRLINAVERFLDASRADIANVAEQTLEGAVREVLATVTLDELREEPVVVSERIVGHALDDFERLGLELDTIKLRDVVSR